MIVKPILFNSQMVKALLDGRKTQTRRAVKPQPNWAWAIPPLPMGLGGRVRGYPRNQPQQKTRRRNGKV